jgi:hypothetical protein
MLFLFIFLFFIHNNNGDFMKKFLIILLCISIIEIYYFSKRNHNKYISDSVSSFVDVSFNSIYMSQNDDVLVSSYVIDTPDNLCYNPNLSGLGFIVIGFVLICKNKFF